MEQRRKVFLTIAIGFLFLFSIQLFAVRKFLTQTSVSYGYEKIFSDLSNISNTLCTLLTLSWLLGIIFLWLTYRFLEKANSRRIAQLSSHITAIASSRDYKQRLPCGSDNHELNNIIHSTNKLLEQIEVNEEELNLGRDRAIASMRAKSEFMAQVSHSIRTPLNGIIGMLQLLKTSDSTSQHQEYTNLTLDAAQELLKSVDYLIEFSRFETGRFRIERVEFAPRQVIEDCLMLYAETAHNKGLELNCLITTDCPEILRGDAQRFVQCLSNILDNAIKFTEEGEVSVNVSSAVINPQKISLICHVKDTGIGISHMLQRKLFQELNHEDNATTRKYTAIGIGLAMTKEIISRMGGEINFESTPGYGSTFWFSLPFEFPAEKQPQPKIDRFLPEFNPKIILADSNPTFCSNMSYYSTRQGYLFDYVHTGEEAFQRLTQAVLDGKPYDLAILNPKLNCNNGISIALNIQKDENFSKTHLVVLRTLFDKLTFECNPMVNNELIKPVRFVKFQNLVTSLFSDPKNTETQSLVSSNCNTTRILLVEDNPVNQMVALTTLSKLGYEADLAENGCEAVDAVLSKDYALVLMDCHMPKMDGYTATQRIKAVLTAMGRRAIPIIAMTANTSDEDKERCRLAGMNDFINKPFSTESFDILLQRWTTAKLL